MFSTIDAALLERILVGGSLAVLAVVVAFGPEISQQLARLRGRGRVAPALQADGQNLGVGSSAS